MEVTVGLFLFLIALAFFCEFIDSALGMGYGTILSPVLMILGFNPLVAVPAILLSQAFGGFAASLFHHHFDNVSFRHGSRDLRIVVALTLFGVVSTVIAAIVAINIPKIVLKTYIGVLVLSMGIIILFNRKFAFSWIKIMIVGAISAFNKGISGGGFGPVVTGGQIMAGNGSRSSIGITTLAEAPICIVAFFTYLIGRTVTELDGSMFNMPVKSFLAKMFSQEMFHWELLLALLIGSVMVAPFGAFTTKKINTKYINVILGVLIVVLGAWALLDTYVF